MFWSAVKQSRYLFLTFFPYNFYCISTIWKCFKFCSVNFSVSEVANWKQRLFKGTFIRGMEQNVWLSLLCLWLLESLSDHAHSSEEDVNDILDNVSGCNRAVTKRLKQGGVVSHLGICRQHCSLQLIFLFPRNIGGGGGKKFSDIPFFTNFRVNAP
jgi:hypothetical protein